MTQADGEISAEIKGTKGADGTLRKGKMTGNSKGLDGKIDTGSKIKSF